MFGFGIKEKAKSLMKTITRFSNVLANQSNIFPDGGNVCEIECVLVGLSAFLAAGFSNNSNLALELIPTYQHKIMPTVNKAEYDRKSMLVQEYYSEYRETAIYYQENVEDWFVPLRDKLAELTAKNLNVEPNIDCLMTLVACILELIDRCRQLSGRRS